MTDKTEEVPNDDGLDETVLYHLIASHTVEKPISRKALVRRLIQAGFPTKERAMRDRIKWLRRQGAMICSTPGTNGGYYYARSAREYEEFRRKEYQAKILDMLETMRAMDKSAAKMFTDVHQLDVHQLDLDLGPLNY